MKTAIFFAAVLCISAPPHVSAADQVFCTQEADHFREWILDSQRKLKGQPLGIESLQLEIAKEQQFTGVLNRMGARANLLLDKHLSPSEIRADLYALCMSLT